MAGDTRLTSGYNINSRYHPKVFKIGGTTADQHDATIALSVVGFAADGEALKERLDAICKMYQYRHGKPMSVKACAQRLSTILYQKRFFPSGISERRFLTVWIRRARKPSSTSGTLSTLTTTMLLSRLLLYLRSSAPRRGWTISQQLRRRNGLDIFIS